jgi:hypothetical protein
VVERKSCFSLRISKVSIEVGVSLVDDAKVAEAYWWGRRSLRFGFEHENWAQNERFNGQEFGNSSLLRVGSQCCKQVNPSFSQQDGQLSSVPLIIAKFRFSNDEVAIA